MPNGTRLLKRRRGRQSDDIIRKVMYGILPLYVLGLLVLIAIEIIAKSEEVSTPVEAIRFSTRQKTETVYNEEEYDIYGLEPEDEEVVKSIDGPVVEEDEGDVIEAILDHRRCHGAGMIHFRNLSSMQCSPKPRKYV